MKYFTKFYFYSCMIHLFLELPNITFSYFTIDLRFVCIFDIKMNFSLRLR